MKTLTALVCMSALVSTLSLTVKAQSYLTNGLVAFYPLDGNANNAVGTNNGTVNGATLTQNRFGVANSAYSFNGTNQNITFAAPPITNIANWTISAWVKPANFTQEGIAVHVGFDDAASGNGYGFGLHGSSTWTGIFSGVGSGFISSGQALPSTNQWYHVVMLRDATTTRFYIDGIQTPTTHTTVPKKPTDFTIGSQNISFTRFFKGQIDEVRIYNRALSSDEVTQLYEQTLPLTIRTAVELEWGTISNQTYQLQYSSDLTNWTNFGSPFAGFGGVTNMFFRTDGTNRFYRLKFQ